MIRRILRRPLVAVALLVLILPAGRALAALTYTVVRGDSLWGISRRYNTTVADLKSSSNPSSDTIYPGQTLTIPEETPPPVPAVLKYTVRAGDTLWLIATRHGVTVDALVKANRLASTTICVGQTLVIPAQPTGGPASPPLAPAPAPAPSPAPVPDPEPESAAPTTYTIRAGDTLWLIANRFGTTVSELKAANGLPSDVIYAGQVLVLPGSRSEPLPSRSAQLVPAQFVYLAGFKVYHVVAGDTLERISAAYGTPIQVITATNRMLTDLLQIGQPVFVQPGGTSPGTITVTAGPHGAGGAEMLDWEHARWLFGGKRQAVIRDPVTGKQFRVRRLGGGSHADCEPLTPADTQVMKSIAGGAWTWTPRPVQVIVDGRVIAASISFMPHSIQTITDNGFDGHFCVHFRHSRTHNTDSEEPRHQANVLEAAALKGVTLPPGL